MHLSIEVASCIHTYACYLLNMWARNKLIRVDKNYFGEPENIKYKLKYNIYKHLQQLYYTLLEVYGNVSITKSTVVLCSVLKGIKHIQVQSESTKVQLQHEVLLGKDLFIKMVSLPSCTW